MPEATQSKHNIGQTERAIVEVWKAQMSIQEKIGELQAERREVRSKIKGLGIKLGDFDAMVRLRNLEDEDRRASIENYKVVYEALSPGEQLNFIYAA